MSKRPIAGPPSFKGLSPANPAASAVGRKNKKTGTRPEKILASALRKKGVRRFMRNHGEVPGTPDVVFLSAKIAVFVDGDFWHGRNWRKRQEKLRKGANASYWVAKIARNRANDRETNRRLKQLGWQVLRFWESELVADPDGVANVIQGAVRFR